MNEHLEIIKTLQENLIRSTEPLDFSDLFEGPHDNEIYLMAQRFDNFNLNK